MEKRYICRKSMGNWWVLDTATKNRVMAMCTREDDGDSIVDALNEKYRADHKLAEATSA